MSIYNNLLQDEATDFKGVLTGDTREELDKIVGLLGEVRKVETLPLQYVEAGDSVYRLTDYSAENKSFTSISLMTGKTPVLSVKSKYESVKDELTEEEFDELMREALSTSLLFRFNGESYFVGYDALGSLADKVGMQEKGIKTNKLERDVWIASELRDNIRAAYNVAYTEVGGIKKIFGVHSIDYRQISDDNILTILDEVAKDLGEYSLKFYVTQNITNVIAYFPEKGREIAATYGMEGFVPAIRFMNSQTGVSNLRVETIWAREEGSSTFYLLDRREKRHRGFGPRQVTPFINDVKANIFDVYTRVPERLVELMDVSLYDGAEGNGENILKETLDSIFEGVGLTKYNTLGIENSNKVKEVLLTAIDTSMPFTAYDVVNLLMDVPERVEGLSKFRIEQIRKAMTKIVFYPYEKLAKEFKAEVFLTA